MRPHVLIRATTIVVAVMMVLALTACATRTFTRNELSTLDGNLSARIDIDEQNIGKGQKQAKELSEHLDAVQKRTNDNTTQLAAVQGEVMSLRTDMARIDAKATDAANSARNAQSSADKANAALLSLDVSLRNRDDYEVVTEKQILFKFDSSTLNEDYESMLTDIATQLKQMPDSFVVLEGHTDGAGDATYNIRLGEKRNDAVTRFLIATLGVPVYKVYQTSLGKEQPAAANDSEEGREKNRRVVLHVFRPKAAAAVTR